MPSTADQKARSRQSDLRPYLDELDIILRNFPQSSHEINSELRELDVDVTSNGLHEDVNQMEIELYLHEIQIIEKITKGPEADFLSYWPHKCRNSETEGFSSTINFISTDKKQER